jgi:hypothetical protein
MPLKKILAIKIFGTNFIGLTLTYLVSFFTPLMPWIIAIGVFVFADLITGMFAAKKKGQKIQSNKMFKTIPKFSAYGLGIIVAHVLTLLFIKDFPAVKLVAGLIAFIEIKSLDENIKAITGVSIFSDLIKMLNPKRNEKPEEEIKDQSKNNEDGQ